MTNRFLTGLMTSLAFLLLSNCLCAQGLGTTTGTLAGEVSDDSGTALPGVLISASGGEGTRTATTEAGGKYIFPYLTPGHYDVRAELQGFITIEQNDMTNQVCSSCSEAM